jgi:hypothetical protein
MQQLLLGRVIREGGDGKAAAGTARVGMGLRPVRVEPQLGSTFRALP